MQDASPDRHKASDLIKQIILSVWYIGQNVDRYLKKKHDMTRSNINILCVCEKSWSNNAYFVSDKHNAGGDKK